MAKKESTAATKLDRLSREVDRLRKMMMDHIRGDGMAPKTITQGERTATFSLGQGITSEFIYGGGGTASYDMDNRRT